MPVNLGPPSGPTLVNLGPPSGPTLVNLLSTNRAVKGVSRYAKKKGHLHTQRRCRELANAVAQCVHGVCQCPTWFVCLTHCVQKPKQLLFVGWLLVRAGSYFWGVDL